MRDYFNSKCLGATGPASTALASAFTSAVLLSSGSTAGVAIGAVMVAFTAGQANRWQATAKGKPFWKPKFEAFGL